MKKYSEKNQIWERKSGKMTKEEESKERKLLPLEGRWESPQQGQDREDEELVLILGLQLGRVGIRPNYNNFQLYFKFL